MTKHLLFAAIAILFLYVSTSAQPGALDNSFGRKGKVMMDIDHNDNTATKLLLQPDGKTIVIGYSTSLQGEEYFSLVRFNTDGSVDETFGSKGFVDTHFHLDYAGALSGTLQPDGKIIVAGYLWNGSTHDFVLMRYTNKGFRDNTFGESGMVSTDFTDFNDSYDKVNDIIMQSDGKIVVCGSKYDKNNLEMDAVLARYAEDGTLDSSFGVEGKVAINVGEFGLWQSFSGIALQSDGKIVAGGYTEHHDEINDTYNDILIVARFLPDGKLDNGFGAGGIAQTVIGKKANGTSIAVQLNGKILLVGAARLTNGGYDELVIVRYNEDGNLDNNFGIDGIVLTSFNNTDDVGNSILMQPDQKIIVAGFTAVANGTTLDFALARYHPNGTLDNSFGSGGKVTTDFDNNWDFGISVALQKNGKIVVAGHSKLAGDYDFALARYLNDNALPVKLENFHAEKEEESVQLRWQTSSESNSDYFEIQRSSNGKDWLQIGSKAAMSNSDSLFSYNFVDSLPSKNNLYRLKMVDADGTFAFSAVKSISFETDVFHQKLKIFPNPTDSRLYFKVRDSSKIDNIVIVNSDGIATPILIEKDNELDIEKFQPGVYHVVVNYTTGDSESGKIVIQ